MIGYIVTVVQKMYILILDVFNARNITIMQISKSLCLDIYILLIGIIILEAITAIQNCYNL